MLGNGDGTTMALTEEDVLLEAGAMGAYALAQPAIGAPDRRNRLKRVALSRQLVAA